MQQTTATGERRQSCDLPIEQTNKCELPANLATAGALALRFRNPYVRADQVIP
jgi:hypothetical protein